MKSKVLWGGYVFILILSGILVINFALSYIFGFGNPVLYNDNPLYGYRPLPNQEVVRFHGKRIKINNLGLRTDQDWDTVRSNKVLFLGNSVTYGGSYIDNKELFSTLALRNAPGMLSASGGVNAWGVSNIHAWLVKCNFYPARYYVSVLLEKDFYRGVALINGSYFPTKKPGSAIHEVVNHYLTSYLIKQQGHFTSAFLDDPKIIDLVYKDAMKDLKDLDDSLKSRGFEHLIFISPTADQVFRKDTINGAVKRLAERHHLKLRYLLDEIKHDTLVEKEIYHDNVHLEVKGHALWARKFEAHLSLPLRSKN